MVVSVATLFWASELYRHCSGGHSEATYGFYDVLPYAAVALLLVGLGARC